MWVAQAVWEEGAGSRCCVRPTLAQRGGLGPLSHVTPASVASRSGPQGLCLPTPWASPGDSDAALHWVPTPSPLWASPHPGWTTCPPCPPPPACPRALLPTCSCLALSTPTHISALGPLTPPDPGLAPFCRLLPVRTPPSPSLPPSSGLSGLGTGADPFPPWAPGLLRRRGRMAGVSLPGAQRRVAPCTSPEVLEVGVAPGARLGPQPVGVAAGVGLSSGGDVPTRHLRILPGGSWIPH